jgi:hypothetical protein
MTPCSSDMFLTNYAVVTFQKTTMLFPFLYLTNAYSEVPQKLAGS